MSTFLCPDFSVADIVEILSNLEIPNVKREDIENPTVSFVVSLYSNLLITIDPAGDHQGQADYSALELLENPDRHDESVSMIYLYHKIKDMAASTLCPVRFTLKDLIKPDFSRTIKFVSAILNFCAHRDDILSLLQPSADRLFSHGKQHEEFLNKISELKSEITEHEVSREREEPKVQQVDAEVKELRQTILNLNKEQMSLKSSFRTFKDKTNEIDEKISNAEFVLVKNAQENAKLRSKIVQSPDKLQRALEEKKSIRAELKNSERSAMQCLQERTATLEAYSKVSRKMSKHLAQMQALQEQVNSAKAIDKDVKVLKVKLGDEEMSDMTLEAKIVERQGKAEQLEESRKALEKEKNLKHSEVIKELNAVKLEMELKLHDLEPRQKKVEAMVAEADNANSNIISLRESGALMQHKLLAKCEEVANEFRIYSSSINAVMQRIEVECGGNC